MSSAEPDGNRYEISNCSIWLTTTSNAGKAETKASTKPAIGTTDKSVVKARLALI